MPVLNRPSDGPRQSRISATEPICTLRTLIRGATSEQTKAGLFPNKRIYMRIVVDLNRCQGYAQCVPLAPEVLKLNGEEALTYDPNPDDAQRLRVLRAAAACPVQAIIVDQLDLKK